MEYVYAALLLHSAEKEVNEENIASVLEAADLEVDDARVKALTTALEGVDIEEAIDSAAMPAAQPTEAPSTTTEEAEGGAEEAEGDAEAEEAEESEEAADEEEEDEGAAGLGDLF